LILRTESVFGLDDGSFKQEYFKNPRLKLRNLPFRGFVDL